MRRVLPLLAVSLMAFAPAPFPRTRHQSTPAPSMEGSWRGDRSMQVSATHITFGEPTAFPYCKVDFGCSGRLATFDFVELEGLTRWLGIYKVEGDTLTICYSQATSGRPTAFAGPGKGQHTEAFKRVKR
jgi:uncharacterized protein (TIGR03067 family)